MNKRIWAIIGLVYMAILIALNTYALATGNFLHGLLPLLICPVIGGFGYATYHNYKAGTTQKRTAIFIILLCVIALIMNLFAGIPSLLSNFGR